MKKLFLLLATLTMCIVANAQSYSLYVEGTVASNGEGKLALMLKNEEPLMVVQGNVVLPEGMTVTGITSLCDIPGNGNYVSDGSYKFLFNSTEDVKIDASNEAVKIADIYVNVDNMEIGEYSVRNYGAVLAIYPIAESAGTFDEITSTVTVQKTAVIEEMPEGYALEVIPFIAKEGASKIDVLFKAPATSKGVTFDIELPQGMMFYDAESEFAPSVPVLNATVCTKTPTVTLSVLDEELANKASVSVMGQNTGAAALRKYINKLDELTTLVSIPVYVVPSDEIADWGEDYALNEGVYEAKINNIVVTDYASNATYSGNYIASVFVGEPITDAILYGHYTTEGKDAAAAMKGGSADITAATVDGELSINDVLIMGKDKTSYARTVGASDYATICLPFAIAGELYTVKEISETSITLAEATEVAANTPAIIKGNINFSKEGYVAPEAPVAGANGLTGTYKYIDKVTGYYLSGNKFYNDYADIKPFRAYIPAPASAKPLSILIETANGIIDITDQLSAEDIYSLQGIKMNKAQKGVNIVGGKKIYVK